MSGGRDDLIESFWRRAPERVAELTDQWLGVEGGKMGELPRLRRSLHTFKGEAHMLGLVEAGQLLEACENVVDALHAAARDPKIAGDALLSGFEGLGLLASSRSSDERLDLGEVFAGLEAALAAIAEPGARPPTAPPPPPKMSKAPAPAATPVPVTEPLAEPATPKHERALPIEDVQPLLHELRRLHAEQALLLPDLAEVQRQVRALLAEIRPDVSAELLRERIVKTLGYGTEIERRLSTLREAWSANEFTTSLAIEQLEDLGHRASLVAVDELVAHVHRIARSTARTLGKDVAIDVTGDALLDAAVEKRLRPCLLHLVRNAVDHGIETAEVRAARHKPPRGRIRIVLVQDETTVRATVDDDGGGIDFAGLRRRLEEHASAPRGLSDAQVLDRIFEQGVSVRDVATEISGRGVGLDVVAKEIAAIGGSVAVESTTGAGTRFMLTVPTKLEADVVVPLLSLGQTYAVSARAVVTVRRVEVLEDTAHGPMMRIGAENGSLVPVHALSSVVQGRGKSRIDDVAVILRHRSGEVALTLDMVQNPRPITFQRTEELAFRSPIVRGVGVLPDGGTIQLLDVEALAGLTRRAGVSIVEATSGEAHALVVEDAPVARELLVGLLRSFGLRVTEAVDGRDGLARALSDRPDIVLTDLEMPYLDGLALISRLRHEPSTAGVPIVVLTTRSDPETEARARALGVRAFLSKHRFVEDRLREVVDACLERR